MLSPDTQNAPTLNSFKYTLRNNQILVPKYFDTLHVSRIAQILHNPIWLKCNSSNSHLFKKNLTDISSVHVAASKQLHTSFSHVLDTQHILNLRHKLSVSLLLRGDPNQPCTVNNIILKHAQLYTLATKRFV